MADIEYLLPIIQSLKNDLVSARQYEAAKHIRDAERLLLPQGPPSMYERIEKLEKALSEEMARTREMDVILAGMVKRVGYVSEAPTPPVYANWVGDIKASHDESWHIHTDPKASPSGVPFSVALEYLKAGRKIRWSKWAIQGMRVESRGHGSVGGMDVITGASQFICPFQPSCEQMTSNDWTVLPEPQNP
jgi:hypothetical protein